MFCYKDRTFCSSNCTNSNCFRFLDKKEEERAISFNFPIAYCDFSGDCEDYFSPLDVDIEPGDLEGVVEDNETGD